MREPRGDYAAPLAALDRVVEVGRDAIRTEKSVHATEPYFRGHYPGHPIYPGVFIFEAVQQAVRRYGEAQGRQLRLSYIKSIRFLAPVLPGDVLNADCEFRWSEDDRRVQVKAICSKRDKRVSRMTLEYRTEK